MKIQIPHKCTKFTKNDNPNKTCENRFRCLIYYDEFCNEYQEKKSTQTT